MGNPSSGGGYGGGQGSGQGYGGGQPYQNTGYNAGGMSPQSYGSGAGGYNPQLMQGMGNDVQFQGGTPFWQPWVGWNMQMGTKPDRAGNNADAAAAMPGAPDQLQHQLGNYLNQPFYTNPNQYGRWNFGTNMQGQGIPSPFGQYAQQTAKYDPVQFPTPPQPPGGGGPPPGQPPAPPPGGQPPAPPPNFGGLSQAQQYMLAKNMGWSSDLNQQLLTQAGGIGAYNQNMNKYANASGSAGGGDYNYAQQLATALNPNTSQQARQYNAGLLKGTPWAQYLGK